MTELDYGRKVLKIQRELGGFVDFTVVGSDDPVWIARLEHVRHVPEEPFSVSVEGEGPTPEAAVEALWAILTTEVVFEEFRRGNRVTRKRIVWAGDHWVTQRLAPKTP